MYMETTGNNSNTRFLVDVPPATKVIFHSSQLKLAHIAKERMAFLNYYGQDYFAKQCDSKDEETWMERWKDQADRRYPKTGDYLVEVDTGLEIFIDLQNTAPENTCSRFLWLLEGLDLSLTVKITYTDCDCVVQTIEDSVSDLPKPFEIQALNTPEVSNGSIVYLSSY